MVRSTTDLGGSMRFEPEDLAADELAFRFETNGLISAAAIGTFLFELERIAHLKSHFGPEASVQILALGTGSLWGKLKIAGAVAVGAAALGDFGLALEERINGPRAAIAQCVAEMTIDSGVVSATITTQDCQVTVHTRDLPAIAHVKQKREASRVNRHRPAHLEQVRAIRVDEAIGPIAGTAPQPYGGRAYGEGTFGQAVPITGGFLGDGDKRGAVNLIGRLNRSPSDRAPITFVTEGGGEYSVDLADELTVSDLVFDSKVMISANHDPGSNWLLIWQVWPIGEL